MQEISKDEIEKGSDISADFKSEDRSQTYLDHEAYKNESPLPENERAYL